jgi:hypothetical protein
MRRTAILVLLSSAVLALTLLGGCDLAPSSEPEPEPDPDLDHCDRHAQVHGDALPLTHAEDWSPSAAPDDPLADHRPAELRCPSSGWGEEFGVLEVRTGECNYLSVEQALAEPLALGDALRVQVWWQSLIALEPAIGHLALLIDGELVWELEVAIPGGSDARSIRFASPIAAEAGATVTFHLHNHGANAWTLGEFAWLGPAEQDPC